MPFTQGLNNVEYTEIPRPAEAWRSTDNSQAIRILECGWDQRYRFVQDLLGWSDYDSGPIITRYTPEQHPDPDFSTFYATDAQLIDSLGVPDTDSNALDFVRFLDKVPSDPIPDPGNEVFGRARYQVTYRQFDYDIFKDEDIATELERYISRYYNFSVENLTLPGNTFEFTNFPTEKIPQLAPIPVPLVELTYVWHQVPDPFPDQAISDALGKVNSALFDGFYLAETLIFIGADVKAYWSVGNRFSWDITYKFQYKANGWNKLYRRTNDTFEPIRRQAAPSKSIYETVSFETLFTPVA